MSSRVKPVAFCIMAEYNQPVKHQKRKTAFHDFARHLGQEVEERGLTEEEFMAQLEPTKRQVFAEQYDCPARGLQNK